MAFPSLPSVPADQLERELLATWKAEDLFHRSLDATRGGTPFVFFEGPPTANGRPGIHHVFSRTIKDLVCRFRAMQGRPVTRIAISAASGTDVEPSYIDAFATSIPVNWQIIVWNSKMVVNVPCAISA